MKNARNLRTRIDWNNDLFHELGRFPINRWQVSIDMLDHVPERIARQTNHLQDTVLYTGIHRTSQQNTPKSGLINLLYSAVMAFLENTREKHQRLCETLRKSKQGSQVPWFQWFQWFQVRNMGPSGPCGPCGRAWFWHLWCSVYCRPCRRQVVVKVASRSDEKTTVPMQCQVQPCWGLLAYQHTNVIQCV